MTGKFWLCGLLTVAVLVCGCGDKGKVETKPVRTERYIVKLQTSMGDIVVELNAQAAPVTVKNFLRYVNEGFYDGTIFHRVIHGFMIQGGGLTADMTEKETHDPIANEAANGLKNLRGTIAMARSEDPDSATSQFFINHVENERLDYISDAIPGYAVFGQVTEGMDVVDAIARVDTTTREGKINVPVEPITIKSARVVSQ
jgi:peptidyl-prolyl cis-trans isomerase A (cyclophilin A)